MGDFDQAMLDIYKFSPLLGLDGQHLLQTWVKRLAACSGTPEERCALDYARYLAFQLQRAQLRFPFSEPPQQLLPDLKEVLFGADSNDQPVIDGSSWRAVSKHPAVHGSKIKYSQDQSCFDDSHNRRGKLQPRRAPPGRVDNSLGNSTWNSHHLDAFQIDATGAEWTSHRADPIQDRAILSQLEDLPDHAPLWHTLARVSPFTRDGGALLQAVLAEELAEWSARLAADQTVAGKFPLSREDDDEEWGPRADRRADYWVELCAVLHNLKEQDEAAAALLTAEVSAWLEQQSRQLQVEQAQQIALIEELKELQRHVAQNGRWRETQYGIQSRALQTEVASLHDSIAANSKKIKILTQNKATSDRQVDSSRPANSTLSISHDSLNTPSP